MLRQIRNFIGDNVATLVGVLALCFAFMFAGLPPGRAVAAGVLSALGLSAIVWEMVGSRRG